MRLRNAHSQKTPLMFRHYHSISNNPPQHPPSPLHDIKSPPTEQDGESFVEGTLRGYCMGCMGCMELHGIAWCHIALHWLHGIAWYCVVLHSIAWVAWCFMASCGIVWCYIVLNGIVWRENHR